MDIKKRTQPSSHKSKSENYQKYQSKPPSTQNNSKPNSSKLNNSKSNSSKSNNSKPNSSKLNNSKSNSSKSKAFKSIFLLLLRSLSLLSPKRINLSLSLQTPFIKVAPMLIGVSFLGITGAWYYYQQTEIVPTSGGQLKEGLVGQPQYINPILVSNTNLQNPRIDRTLSTLLYPHLFHLSDQGKLENDLVTDYKLSEDNTTYTLFLDETRSWQDDTSITAKDVVYTMKQIQNAKLKSPLQARLEDIDIEQTGEYEVTLTLSESYSPFIYNLTFGILPEHIWSQYNDQEFRQAPENIKPVAGGQFVIENIIESEEQNRIDSYVLQPREELQDTMEINQLALHFYQNQENLITAFNNQEIQAMSVNTFLTENPEIQKHTMNIPQYFALFFNTNSDLFNEYPELMQAMQVRLDKQELNTIISQGQSLPVDGPLTPMNTFYTSTEETSSRGEAERILSQNGWSLNDDRNLEKDGTVAQFTVKASQSSKMQELMEFLQSQFSDIGIQMNVENHSFQELSENYIPERDYDALFIGTALRTYPDPYLYWHSSQVPYPGFNLSQYTNANLDTLLEEARTIHDRERIKEKMSEFQSVIRNESPAIFLYSPQFTYYTQAPLTGVDLTQGESAAGRFHTLSEWQVNTKRQFSQ